MAVAHELTETTIPATPTKDELRIYAESSAERKRLESLARQAGKNEDLLKDKIMAYITYRQRMENKTAFQKDGYILTISNGAVRPKWADAFLAECGVAKAQAVIAATKPSQSVKVEKAHVK